MPIRARTQTHPRRAFVLSTVAGSLTNDEILSGRNESEKVTSVETFTGSAFDIPPEAQPIIVLPQDYGVLDCGLPCPPDAPKQAGGGHYQGAVLRFGQGKIAVFGEAAMFSAQILKMRDGRPFYFGFNAPTAAQNRQFILNLVRWLVMPRT